MQGAGRSSYLGGSIREEEEREGYEAEDGYDDAESSLLPEEGQQEGPGVAGAVAVEQGQEVQEDGQQLQQGGLPGQQQQEKQSQGEDSSTADTVPDDVLEKLLQQAASSS
jgi:hypothetical protein